MILEVQLPPKNQDDIRAKRAAWPRYTVWQWANTGLPAYLVVVTPSRAVERWASQPIPIGHPGFVLSPIVLGPSNMPVIERELGLAVPELAVVSAIVHGRGARAEEVATLALEAVLALDPERRKLYVDAVLAVLRPGVRQKIEAMMAQKHEYMSDFARRYVAEGKAEGKAEGEAKGKAEGVLRVLEARGFAVPAEVAERVRACRDLATLDAWLVRAATLADSACATSSAAEMRVAPGTIVRRERESPSSLGGLVGCPLQYVLHYQGNVEAGLSGRIEDADSALVSGSLAHKIIGELLERSRDSGSLSAQEAREEAGRLFDQQAPRLVADLFLPGRDAARSRLRHLICEAAADITAWLARTGLKPTEVEKEYEASAFGIQVGGRLDLLVAEPRAVVDLKLGGRTKREAELEQGTACQLAIYAHTARSVATGPALPVAYDILANRKLLTTDRTSFGQETHISGPSSHTTWQPLGRAVQDRLSELDQGTVRAPGVGWEPKSKLDVGGITDGKMNLSPPCNKCDFELLCGRDAAGR